MRFSRKRHCLHGRHCLCGCANSGKCLQDCPSLTRTKSFKLLKKKHACHGEVWLAVHVYDNYGVFLSQSRIILMISNWQNWIAAAAACSALGERMSMQACTLSPGPCMSAGIPNNACCANDCQHSQGAQPLSFGSSSEYASLLHCFCTCEHEEWPTGNSHTGTCPACPACTPRGEDCRK